MMLAKNRAVAAPIREPTQVIMRKAIFGRDYDYDALVAAEGNLFALLTEVSERDLRFAVWLHRLTGVVAAVAAVRFRLSRSHARRAQPDRRGDGAPGADRRGHGSDRRWPRNHRERPRLDVVSHRPTGTSARVLGPRRILPMKRLEPHGAEGDLPFIGRIINETLRLCPPGWLLSRRVCVDTRLGAHRLPAGSQVFISP